MRWIKYQIVQTINGEEPILVNKKVGYSNENLVIAQSEAYNGYEIVEDGMVFDKEPLNMHGARVKNVGYAEEDGDAVNLGFLNDHFRPADAPTLRAKYDPETKTLVYENAPEAFDQWLQEDEAKLLFAPRGFGLGTYGQTAPDDDANQIMGSGFYRAYHHTPNPEVWWNIIHMDCYEGNSNASVQIANGYVSSSQASICVRQKYNGTWGEWEWVNPPMLVGVTYRTTRRRNGNPVYARRLAFTCGAEHVVYIDPKVYPANNKLIGFEGSIYNSDSSYWFQLPSSHCFVDATPDGYRLTSTDFDMRSHYCDMIMYYEG